MISGCLDERLALELVRGSLPAEQAGAALEHVESCDLCRRFLSELVKLIPAEPDSIALSQAATQPRQHAIESTLTGAISLHLDPGACVDRYVVHRILGIGAMGVVYLAHDPQLHRNIALKVLKRSESAAGGLAPDRLLAEARAMARLQHPSVVQVHDAGTFEGHIFIAMEWVDGATATCWMKQHQRRAQEVLELFIEAGRGLVAAHEAGLIHGDFKPDNILVDSNGRARVTDFGLARAASAPLAVVNADCPEQAADALRAASPFAGTPAYMAPEQFRGVAGDARADQFSFCVALYEGLFGVRPFSGSSRAELIENVLAHRVVGPKGKGRPPRWLRQVVRRGLSSEPERRHPSMAILLEALAKGPRSQWRWRALAVVLCVVTIAVAAHFGLRAHQRMGCERAGQRIENVWNAGSRKKIEAAFLSTGSTNASASWNRVRATLDAYATSWSAMATSSCVATRITGEQSKEVAVLRADCLADQLGLFEALTAIYAQADRGVVEKAIAPSRTPLWINRCADLPVLRAQGRPGERVANAAIRKRLVQGDALFFSGKIKEAVQLDGVLLAEAHARGDRHLEAEVLNQLGPLQELDGNPKVAENTLFSAVVLAEELGSDFLKADALTKLVWVVGGSQRRYPEAIRLGELAQAALERSGNDAAIRSRLTQFLGILFDQQGQYKRAIEHYQEGLKILEQYQGAYSFQLGSMLTSIGISEKNLGLDEQALAHFQQASSIMERLFGPEHPFVAMGLLNLSGVLAKKRRFDEATTAARTALSILERAFGPDHEKTGLAVLSLAEVRRDAHDFGQALELYRRAIRITEKAPDPVALGFCFGEMGGVELRLGHLTQARAAIERALLLLERGQGKSADVAEVQFLLARTLWAGNFDRARAQRMATAALATLRTRPEKKSLVLQLESWRKDPRQYVEAD